MVSLLLHFSPLKLLLKWLNVPTIPLVITSDTRFMLMIFRMVSTHTMMLVKLITHLCSELMNYGFHLRKWTSNDATLITQLDETLRESPNELELFSNDYKIKTSGVVWKPNQDSFCLTITLDDIKTTTKRTFLSTVSKLFDPMGRLSGNSQF